MNEESRRRSAFLAIICRSRFGYWPRHAVEAWCGEQFDLLKSGWRRPEEIADMAMTAWYLTAPPTWTEYEARRLARKMKLPGDVPEDDREPVVEWPPVYRRAS